MEGDFFAAVARMKYIERWGLMRSSRVENLSEHSMEVAMIAHALCLIGNKRLGKDLDADRAAVIGLYHDATEIITGDLPTPVKYYSREMRETYRNIEKIAQYRLLEKLPDSLRGEYGEIFKGRDGEEYIRGLVKVADKLSAYIKCLEEEKAGNGEFSVAKDTIGKSVEKLCEEYPEAGIFVSEFLPSYGKTLDEL